MAGQVNTGGHHDLQTAVRYVGQVLRRDLLRFLELYVIEDVDILTRSGGLGHRYLQ